MFPHLDGASLYKLWLTDYLQSIWRVNCSNYDLWYVAFATTETFKVVLICTILASCRVFGIGRGITVNLLRVLDFLTSSYHMTELARFNLLFELILKHLGFKSIITAVI